MRHIKEATQSIEFHWAELMTINFDDYNALVAITIMIAESKPEEKEAMVNLVMNFLE